MSSAVSYEERRSGGRDGKRRAKGREWQSLPTMTFHVPPNFSSNDSLRKSAASLKYFQSYLNIISEREESVSELKVGLILSICRPISQPASLSVCMNLTVCVLSSLESEFLHLRVHVCEGYERWTYLDRCDDNLFSPHRVLVHCRLQE